MKPYPLMNDAARVEIKHRHLAEHRSKVREEYRKSRNPRSLLAVSMADRGYGWEDICRHAHISEDAARELVLGIPRP